MDDGALSRVGGAWAHGGGSTARPPPLGTLLAMCSPAEATEREKFRELSVLEQRSGTHLQKYPAVDMALAVKRYQRPAAGAPPPPPAELRPLHVLEKTVDHLLGIWGDRLEVAPAVRYTFISDRLRAVQQDLTVQRIHAPHLLVRIARFHALMEAAFASHEQRETSGFSRVHNRMLLCNALITALQEAPTNGAEMCGRNGHTLPIAKCVNTDLGRLSLDDDVAQPCATINSREVSASDIAAAFAITTGSTECTDELLSLVRIVGANASMHGGIWDSWTLLHAAAYKGHPGHVSLLLENGAAPDAQNKKGDTPLSKAVNKAASAEVAGSPSLQHLSVIRLLLAANANASLANSRGVTPLDAAGGALAVRQVLQSAPRSSQHVTARDQTPDEIGSEVDRPASATRQDLAPNSHDPAVYAELLGYFLLLHAAQPEEFTVALAAAPPSAVSSLPVQLAIRVAGALSRSDAADITRALRTAPPLCACCLIGLLPSARSVLMRQLNAASNGREVFPLDVLARLLWLPDVGSAEIHANAHGVPVEEGPLGRGVRLKQAGFRWQPEKPLPALPPLELARWYGDGRGRPAFVLRGNCESALWQE